MKQAPEEARAASEKKAGLPNPSIPAPSIPAPSIPAPNIPAPSATSEAPAPGKFNIPAPSATTDANAKTEMVEAIQPVDPSAETQFGGSAVPTQPTPMVQTPTTAPAPAFVQPQEAPLMAKPEVSMATAPGTYQKGEVRDPLKTLLICLLTCGFGNMYMLLKWSDEVNGGLGEQKYNGVMILVIGMLTCGLYAIYQLWNMCNDVAEIQRRWGVEPEQEGMILFLMHLVYVGPMFFQRASTTHGKTAACPANPDR
ncbi:MAG: hypothetical protein R3E66_21285 [bacterium]